MIKIESIEVDGVTYPVVSETRWDSASFSAKTEYFITFDKFPLRVAGYTKELLEELRHIIHPSDPEEMMHEWMLSEIKNNVRRILNDKNRKR